MELDSDIARNVRILEERRKILRDWNSREDSAGMRMAGIRRYRLRAVAAAACIVIACGIFLLSRFVQPESNHTPVYRGSDPDVETVECLLSEKRFDEALVMSDSIMQSETQDIVLPSEAGSEETLYIERVREEKVYRMQWLKLLALYGSGDTARLLPALREFAGKEGEYRKDALKILHRYED